MHAARVAAAVPRVRVAAGACVVHAARVGARVVLMPPDMCTVLAVCDVCAVNAAPVVAVARGVLGVWARVDLTVQWMLADRAVAAQASARASAPEHGPAPEHGRVPGRGRAPVYGLAPGLVLGRARVLVLVLVLVHARAVPGHAAPAAAVHMFAALERVHGLLETNVQYP